MIQCPHCDFLMTSSERHTGNCPVCGKSLGADIVAQRRIGSSEWESPFLSVAADNTDVSSILRWGSVRTALAMVGVGSCLVVGSMLITTVLPEIRFRNVGGQFMDFYVVPFLMLIGAAQVLSGICICCVAPWRSGAPAWAVAAVGSLAVAAATLLFQPLVPEVFQREALVATSVVQGAAILAGLFFSCFLIQVARYFENYSLATVLFLYLATSLLIQIGFVVLTYFRLGVFDQFRLHGNATFFWRWVTLAVVVALTVWFSTLIILVRRTVANGLVRRRYF
jgi:hypothetical protein